MADLPDIKKFTVEDFEDAPEWATKMFSMLNSTFNDLYKAFNKDLTITENFRGFYKELDIDGAQFPITFENEMKVKPKAVLIAQITEVSPNYVIIVQPTTIDWQDTNQGIQINNITNLTGGTQYKVVFLVIGDDNASIN